MHALSNEEHTALRNISAELAEQAVPDELIQVYNDCVITQPAELEVTAEEEEAFNSMLGELQ